MLEFAQIENFRCLRNVKIKFTPLTVLVGPNASGKSTILDALNPQSAVDSSDYWQHQGQRPVLTIRGHRPDGAPTSWNGFVDQATSQAVYRLRMLHLDVLKLRQPNPAAESPVLARDGGNLANVLATIPRRQMDALSKQFCALVPEYADVDVRPTQSNRGTVRVVFQDRWSDPIWHEPERVSDGTMLVLAYLTVPYWREPVDVLAIEEPERGLHPYLLGEVIAILRRLTRGEIGGRAVQVILATHSAELLEHVAPEEVRFVSRDRETGETRVEQAPTGTDDWRDAYKEYEGSVGAMWLSGSLGGVPGR